MTNNELLRKLVPGVKAEYEVKYLAFPQLVAFLVVKSVNESINYMIFDYEKIFHKYISDVPIETNTEIEMDISIEVTVDEISNIIKDSIVSLDLFAKYNLESISNNMILYVSELIKSIVNMYCTDDGIKYLSDNNIYYPNVIGIGFDDTSDNLKLQNAKDLFISKIPSFVSEVVNHILELNSKYVSQQQNNVINVSTAIPSFQPVEQVANTTPRVDLVGWSDIKPGILDTEQSVHQPTGNPKYDQLSEQDKLVVDGIIKGLEHLDQMKSNPHAFSSELDAAKAALNQATSDLQQQASQPTVNIDVTKAPDGCNCGNDHCNCGNH